MVQGAGSAIIFGGAGFIGRHLAARLVERGYDRVVIADIAADPGIPGTTHIACDVRHPIAPISGEPFGEAYNLAAVHRTPGHPDFEYFETNVSGAINVVNHCLKTDIRRLVFTSSISVYGATETGRHEGSPLEPTSAYGRSKLQAEDIHRLWAVGGPDRKLAITRPGVVFGPGESGNFTRLARALKAGRFVYPGRRDTIKACGYVGELLRTIEYALEREEAVYLYNFCYPSAYRLEDICDAFHRVAGYKPPRGMLPTPFLMSAAFLFEALNAAGVRNGICRERIRKLIQSTHIVPRKLAEDGYRFETDLDESLRRWLGSDPARPVP
jgi:nucleoside-diphosphate-sugar epimerase